MNQDEDERVGYEYNHTFEVDQGIVNRYDPYTAPGGKVVQFEISTSFGSRLDAQTIAFEEQQDIFDIKVILLWDGLENLGFLEDLEYFVQTRLDDYGMDGNAIRRFVASAHQTVMGVPDGSCVMIDPEHEPNRIIVPISARIQVITTPQPSETQHMVFNRRITAVRMVPSYLSVHTQQTSAMGNQIKIKLLALISPKIRVATREQGFALMETCSICGGEPWISDCISTLRPCHHAFHTHCLARVMGFLMEMREDNVLYGELNYDPMTAEIMAELGSLCVIMGTVRIVRLMNQARHDDICPHCEVPCRMPGS